MTATKRWSSADLNIVIARVAPEILALLGDGVPRSEAAIVTALADRHPKDDVRLTVMRLDVVGRLDLQGSRYTLAAAEAEQGWDADHEERRELSVEDGIAAVRTLLPRCWFDRVRCRMGLDFLRQYRAQYDEKRQVLSNRPLHDRASHAADAFRVLATAHRSAVARPGKLRRRELAWIV